MGQRLPSLSYRAVAKALSKVDFREIAGRGKGSHVFVYRDTPPKGITDPKDKNVKRGTLRSIMREVDLTVDEFRALL